MTDAELMALALAEARKAAGEGEVPVGAVVARRGEVISVAHNRREGGKNALHHAELLAIDAACKALGGWRLWECEMFVTLEPCPMCAGGIINSRIRRLVYAAKDPKAGCCGSVTDLFAMPFNHRPAIEQGLCEPEAAALLAEFFARLRLRNRDRGAARWKKPVAAQPAKASGPAAAAVLRPTAPDASPAEESAPAETSGPAAELPASPAEKGAPTETPAPKGDETP